MVYGRYIASMVSKPRNKTGGTPQIIDVTLWQSPDSSALFFRGGTGIKKKLHHFWGVLMHPPDPALRISFREQISLWLPSSKTTGNIWYSLKIQGKNPKFSMIKPWLFPMNDGNFGSWHNRNIEHEFSGPLMSKVPSETNFRSRDTRSRFWRPMASYGWPEETTGPSQPPPQTHRLIRFPYDPDIGGFLKWGYPQASSISAWDFPLETTHSGVHPFMENPISLIGVIVKWNQTFHGHVS